MIFKYVLGYLKAGFLFPIITILVLTKGKPKFLAAFCAWVQRL